MPVLRISIPWLGPTLAEVTHLTKPGSLRLKVESKSILMSPVGTTYSPQLQVIRDTDARILRTYNKNLRVQFWYQNVKLFDLQS